MSQMIARRASISAVAIIRPRPLAYSAATSLRSSSVTDLRVSVHSGRLSAIASLKTPVIRPRGSITSFGEMVV